MKRSSLPPRKTPLTARTPLVRTGALARRGALVCQSDRTRQAPIAAKRPKVTGEERLGRKAVRVRSGGVCEVCGRERATNFQHRKAVVHGGTYCPSNGLDVCGHGNLSGCHGRIHQNPRIAYERGWSVRSGFDPAEIPVWLAGRGWHHLTADGGTTPVPTEGAAA